MKKTLHCAAVDLGATSGRVIVGTWSGGRLTLDEVHRFPNAFHSLGASDYWDIPGLWHEVTTGLARAREKYPRLASVGVDTWGVDHVLLDARGRLVYPTHAYRDARTQPGLRRLHSQGLAAVYAATGIPPVFYNTSLQLEATLRTHPAVRDLATRCLFLPDYFHFLLSGRAVNELSIASTSQLLDVNSRTWSAVALERFGIPKTWFTRPVPAGTRLGSAKNLPGFEGVQVVAVPGHDTACAFAAMPADPWGGDLFISSGTWSLVGFESYVPLLGPEALDARIANERAGDGGYRPLKNIIGMWLLEGVLKDLAARPKSPAEWETLIRAAEELPPPPFLLDTADPAFVNPPSMRAAIDAQLRSRGAKLPRSAEAYTRLVCASLGQAHADAVRLFARLGNRSFRRILIAGGGSKNRLLCQATADASGLPVTSLQLEGSAVGNLAHQFLALGLFPDLAAFRRLVSASFPHSTFLPQTPAPAPTE